MSVLLHLLSWSVGWAEAKTWLRRGADYFSFIARWAKGRNRLVEIGCGQGVETVEMRRVVSTDVTSLPEVIEDGVTGFAIPPNTPQALSKKIQWLGDNPDAIHAMIQVGRKRDGQLFTWSQLVQQCLPAY
jgi:hypothetical protein